MGCFKTQLKSGTLNISIWRTSKVPPVLVTVSSYVLIGHNIQNVDLPVFIHQLSKHNLLKSVWNYCIWTPWHWSFQENPSLKLMLETTIIRILFRSWCEKPMKHTMQSQVFIIFFRNLFHLKLKCYCVSDDISFVILQL